MSEIRNSQAKIIVVSGAPGSGKTTLARELADRLGIALLSRDMFKEAMMDVLPSDTIEQTRALGQAAYRAMYATADAILATSASVILESNFGRGRGEADFARYLGKVAMIQIHCTAPDELLIERFAERAESTDRHPGHHDQEMIPHLRQDLADGRYDPLDLGIALIVVDTTDGLNPDADQVVRHILGIA
jgi:predicted kinase